MLRLKHLCSSRASIVSVLPFSTFGSETSARFLDIYKDSADEMNRDYLADLNEHKQHGGKIAMANKIIIPAMTAVKFPGLELNNSHGKTLKLLITSNENVVNVEEWDVPKASLLCLSFQPSSQVLNL